MSVPAFAAVAKPTKDLLEKAYPSTYKVDLTAAGTNGFTFTASTIVGDIPPAKDAKSRPEARTTAAVSGITVGSFSAFKVDKIAVDSHKIVSADFSLAEAFKGAKLTFAAVDATRAVPVEANKPVLATIGVEYKHERATVNASYEAINKEFVASAVASYEGFLAGASGKVTFGDSKASVADYGAVVGYKAKAITASVAGEKKFDWFTASYHQVVNSQVAVSASAKLPRSKDVKNADSDASVSAGVQYKAAPEVTWSAKVASNGKDKADVSLSYAQQLSASAKITVGAKIDALEIAADKHSFNVAFSLSA